MPQQMSHSEQPAAHADRRKNRRGLATDCALEVLRLVACTLGVTGAIGGMSRAAHLLHPAIAPVAYWHTLRLVAVGVLLGELILLARRR